MAECIVLGGGGGVSSSDVTAAKAQVLKGYKTVTEDSNDEVVEGEFELTGNATAAHVLQGETFYSDGITQKTGTMTVNSVLSFNLAVANGRAVTVSWTVPTATSGKPYSGIIIRYGTSGYPTSLTDGTHIYMGNGGATSETGGDNAIALITLPNLRTKYYISIWTYVACSAGELYNDVNVIYTGPVQKEISTGNELYLTITGDYTIPTGYNATIYLIGGGASGQDGSDYRVLHSGGTGGGSGYVTTVNASSGTLISNVLIGAGGAYKEHYLGGHYQNAGESTSCTIGSTQYSVNGGSGSTTYGTGGLGYKQGGAGAYVGGDSESGYVGVNAEAGLDGIWINGTCYSSSGGGGGYYSRHVGIGASGNYGGSGAGNGFLGNNPGYSSDGSSATTAGSGGGGAGQRGYSYNDGSYGGGGGAGAAGAIIAHLY